MAYIIIQQRKQIVTQSGLSQEEQKHIEKMVDNNKTIGQIENYLLKRDHIFLHKLEGTEKKLTVINTAVGKLDFDKVLKALDEMFCNSH